MKGRAGWDSSQCGAAGESRPAQDKITMMTVWEKKKVCIQSIRMLITFANSPTWSHEKFIQI